MGLQETFSVGYIQELCLLSGYLDGSDIKIGDKFPCYDGNIVYYSERDSKIKGDEHFIPVQVKGKLVDEIIEKEKISYRVGMPDIKNYFSNGGVLYLVAEVTEYAQKRLYAKLLLPIDIKKLTERKETQDSVTIHLNAVENAEKLVSYCDLFIKNRAKQNFIICNSTPVDLRKISKFTISVLNSPREPSVVDLIYNDNAYVYAVENGVEKPVLLDLKFIREPGESEQKFKNGKVIKCNNDVIYTKGMKKHIIADIIEFLPDAEKDNVTFGRGLDLNFEKTYNGAIFAREMILEDEDAVSAIIRAESDIIEFYNEVIFIGEICNMLRIPLYSFKTQEILKNKNSIISLKQILIDGSTVKLVDKPELWPTLFRIGEKAKIVIYKKEEGTEYRGYDIFANNPNLPIQAFAEGGAFKTVVWFGIDPEIINDLYIDFDFMFEEFKKLSPDIYGYEYINTYILRLISEFDEIKKYHLLKIALDLAELLIENIEPNEVYIINKMQVKKRMDKLNDEDKLQLTRLKRIGDNIINCCVSVILEQWVDFEVYFDVLTDNMRTEFMSWPIYKLYEDYKK